MLVKRSIGVAIVLFWCLSHCLPAKAQHWASPPPITLPSTEKITERIEESWGVFYRGDKIGYASQIIDPKPQGYRIRDQSVLRLQLLGTTQTATTQLETEVDPEWTLQNFNFDLQSDDVRLKARGQVTQGQRSQEVEPAGDKTKNKITLQ